LGLSLANVSSRPIRKRPMTKIDDTIDSTNEADKITSLGARSRLYDRNTSQIDN
jgi:hypothetical protein